MEPVQKQEADKPEGQPGTQGLSSVVVMTIYNVLTRGQTVNNLIDSMKNHLCIIEWAPHFVENP